MKLTNRIFLPLLFGGIMTVTSCTSESPWTTSQDFSDGKIEISIITDSEILTGTRGEETKFIVPEASQFSISLKSADGSIDKVWDSVKKFNSEEGFPMGYYNLSAFYGDFEVEGFENPYFYGEEEIEVMLGHTTVQTITASLANSMVSIRYNNDLKSMFKAYSAALQTEGHNTVSFVQEEERPAYMTTGVAKLFVTLTNDKDETVTVNLADLKLESKHHYIVTLGVNKDNLGNNVLDVNVTEDITVEEVEPIILSEEFFSAPVPVITAIGFDPQKSLDFFEAFTSDIKDPIQFHVMALAGIKTATLKLTTEGGFLPFENNEKDEVKFSLVKATQDVKDALESANIICRGFFENAEEFSYIDFTDYVKNLAPGSYTASIEIVDLLGRTMDVNLPPVVLKANVDEVKYEIAGYKKPNLFDNKIYLAVSTNCDIVKDSFNFISKDENGSTVEVEVKRLDTNPGLVVTGAKYDNIFYYELSTAEINDNQWMAAVKYAQKNEDKVIFDVTLPSFTIETDAFAKRVKVLITPENKDLTEKIVNALNVKYGDSFVSGKVKVDRSQASQGMLLITGLNAKGDIVDNAAFDGDYNMSLYFGNTLRADYTGEPFSFTTEQASDVPNGDFEEMTQKINFTINQGGTWTDWNNWGRQQTTEDYHIYEPDLWATVNNKTCNRGASSQNTWFVVPSTYQSSTDVKNGMYSMVLRNVGYNYKGTVPSNQTNVNVHPYNSKTPGDESAHKAVGKLFLGSYSIDTSDMKETYQEGIDFYSRPDKLSGYYKYTVREGDPDDKGLFDLVLSFANGKTISKTVYLDPVSDWTLFTIDFSDYDWRIPVTNLKIMIASSFHSSYNYEEEDQIVKVKPYTEYTQKYLGSELMIDNLFFEY